MNENDALMRCIQKSASSFDLCSPCALVYNLLLVTRQLISVLKFCQAVEKLL